MKIEEINISFNGVVFLCHWTVRWRRLYSVKIVNKRVLSLLFFMFVSFILLFYYWWWVMWHECKDICADLIQSQRGIKDFKMNSTHCFCIRWRVIQGKENCTRVRRTSTNTSTLWLFPLCANNWCTKFK